MLALVLESKDPLFNLAAEDYLLHERGEDFLILSVNDPAVIIGKHQVAHMEVNARLTTLDNIPVLRRISGGGTVYHDRGNLNFAFIRQSEAGKQVDFRLYTKPVLEFLKWAGVTAVFEGKNDLTVGGLKISGNAEHVFRERVLHHGTLLFDASLENMKKYLRPSTMTYTTRGVASNRTSVTNLIGKIPGIDSMEKFIKTMAEYFLNNTKGIAPFSLENDDVIKIEKLVSSRYSKWEWNWGYGPPYEFAAGFRVSGVKHRCRFLVKDGIIWESDFEGSKELKAASKNLIGCRHHYPDMLKTFRDCRVSITDEEIYDLF